MSHRGPCLVFLVALLGSAVASAQEPAPTGYAGADTCSTCHESLAQGLAKTAHGTTSAATWDGATACESCHGPGAEHVAAGGDATKIRRFPELSPTDQAAVCLTCHDRDEHTRWRGSAHEGRGLSCLTCHRVHHDEAPPAYLLAKPTEFDTCGTCHLKRKAALMRSSHMPMREGQMNCSSCHDAHGSTGPALLRQESINENCYSCHAEKRSPMLWEHPPVKENCMNCHDPHGSLHPRMQIAKQPRLCQQCHDEARHPTQPYADAAPGSEFFPGSRMFDRGCMNCHSQVHGSNHPAGARLLR